MNNIKYLLTLKVRMSGIKEIHLLNVQYVGYHEIGW